MSTIVDQAGGGRKPSDRMTPEYQARLRTAAFTRQLSEQLRIQQAESAQLAGVVKILADRVNSLSDRFARLLDVLQDAPLGDSTLADLLPPRDGEDEAKEPDSKGKRTR